MTATETTVAARTPVRNAASAVGFACIPRSAQPAVEEPKFHSSRVATGPCTAAIASTPAAGDSTAVLKGDQSSRHELEDDAKRSEGGLKRPAFTLKFGLF